MEMAINLAQNLLNHPLFVKVPKSSKCHFKEAAEVMRSKFEKKKDVVDARKQKRERKMEKLLKAKEKI